MKTQILFLLFVLISVKIVENAKILSVLPLPTSNGHYLMFMKLFKGLVAKGHEIDFITPVKETRTIPGLNIYPMEIADIYWEFRQFSLAQLRGFSTQTVVRKIFAERSNICEECFKSEVMKKIRDSKKTYDLLILEVFAADCIHGYAYNFNIPVISMTTSVDLPWGTWRLGNPDNPAYISNYFGEFMQDSTLYERVWNTFYYIETKLLHWWFMQQANIEAKKFFGHDLPPLDDLVANSSLFLLNSHFTLNQPRPNIPNVIEVAGLHLEEPKPLKTEFTNFIGNSKFIYFSLGSLISPEVMPFDSLQDILNTFKHFTHKVLWKADMEKVPKNLKIPDNVLVEKWMPQLDILCHPNILFFITHNGLMSTQEAVYCGVPMLSLPGFCDQFLNSNTMVKKEIAIEISLETSKDDLLNAMKELIDNKKYKENAVRLSEQFKDRPRKPLDEAVYWVEYVLRHNGAPQLKSNSRNLYWYQYHLIDIIAIITLLIILFLSIIYAGLKIILGRKQSVKQKQS